MTPRAALGVVKLSCRDVWCLVKPKGTMPTPLMPGRSQAHSNVSRRASPSFTPGMSTIWA